MMNRYQCSLFVLYIVYLISIITRYKVCIETVYVHVRYLIYFNYQNEHIPCIDSNEASLYIECKAKM